MDVKYAFLADAANHEMQGKVNVLGIFRTIYCLTLPFQQPIMWLVVCFELSNEDLGVVRKLDVELVSPTGKSVSKQSAFLDIPQGPIPFSTIDLPQIYALGNFGFEEEGTHQLKLLIDDREMEYVNLDVMQIKQENVVTTN